MCKPGPFADVAPRFPARAEHAFEPVRGRCALGLAIAMCWGSAACSSDAGAHGRASESAKGDDEETAASDRTDAAARSHDAGNDSGRARDAGALRDASRDGLDAEAGGAPPSAAGAAADAARAAADAGSRSSEPFPDLSFAGLVSAIELAPVRLAANGLYPAHVTIGSGGVDNLFGAGALIATNAETQALRASVQHPNLRIIFTVCEGLYRIVAKRSSGIGALADLRGKSIAVPAGTSSHYFLVKMLGLANLSEQDVAIVGQAPVMGFLTTDAATVWEPGIQYVSDELGSDAIEFQNDDQGREVYRELFNLHATAESLADAQKRRAIVEFVRSLITASEELRGDPSLAWPLLTGPTGASQAVLEKSWKYERFAGGLASDLLDVLEEEEQWRAKLDGRSARTRAQLAPLIDDSVLSEAMM